MLSPRTANSGKTGSAEVSLHVLTSLLRQQSIRLKSSWSYIHALWLSHWPITGSARGQKAVATFYAVRKAD